MTDKFVEIENEAKDEFKWLLWQYIIPLFSNSILVESFKEVSDSNLFKSQNFVSLYKNIEPKKLVFKFNPRATFCFEVELADFDEIDDKIKLANNVLRELLLVFSYKERNGVFVENKLAIKQGTSSDSKNREEFYKQIKYDAACEYGISLWAECSVFLKLILKLKCWAQITYESKNVPFCFLVETDKSTKTFTGKKVNFVSFLDNKHSAVFTDGETSSIHLDCEGNVINYLSAKELVSKPMANETPLLSMSPFYLSEICNLCEGTTIGVILQSNGDLLLMKDKKLVLARISGKWKSVDFFGIKNKILQFLNKTSMLDEQEKNKFARQIFLSIVDISFARDGGCLAIIKEPKGRAYKLYKSDFLGGRKGTEQNLLKRDIIKKLIEYNDETPFYNLKRKLREEILSLDGATIMDCQGKILAAGAIVHVKGGSDGGGRLAATKELSQFGLAIKISMDGEITGYSNGNEIFSMFKAND